MKKSLTENIMNSKQGQQRMNARKNKVAFLAMREDISAALEKGWSITVIWETLRDEGSFTATYNTFRLYVLKYLSGQKSGYSQKESVAVRTTKSVENQSSKKKDISKSSFSYNPIKNIKGLL
ncbi:TraK family protein [Legionella pneumophila]|uniref:Conjugal transfer protein TraK n=1 Tax=Legionella pneumophila (strain Lens) TaxID=297245 RepID=Q5X0E9_LEGPL|nr:TraK family protein [Legionella pneumophila]AOW53190.1 conjugal transfer protein TraK [Legionella pneumophila subsp. pneumophila]AOW55910.1 conjugal transfer protein TraK [Legionella pneumophila subsp. pneumophila]AOW63988.1 conjugal transfer protein TraK [Legionella pneumophila subsp. pneumophila]MCK1848720.1 TraK family protein [Legionella pneumophila]RYW82900.1 conjugal transfer protein TraK [Legionella pneumophila]